MAFRALQIAGKQDGYDFPFAEDGKLTMHGLNNCLPYLPVAPMDCSRDFIDALRRLGPHYLA